MYSTTLKGLIERLKTIREISETTGKTKTAIYALIKSHRIPTQKKNGLTYVNEHGISLILAHYMSGQHETIKDIIQDSINVNSQLENSGIISILEKQLDEKQEIIRGLLQSNQALIQAQTNEQKLRAVPLLTENQSDSEAPESKPNFLKGLFKRKK